MVWSNAGDRKVQGCYGWGCEYNATAAAADNIELFIPPTPPTFGIARSSTDIFLRLSLTSLEGGTAISPTACSPASASATSASSGDRNNKCTLATCPAASQKIALVLTRAGEREETGGQGDIYIYVYFYIDRER